MENLLKYVEQQTAKDVSNTDFFKPGDTVVVDYKIVEGSKERIQQFRGNVIQVKGKGVTKTFTVRKISNGVGVERVFPFNSPAVVQVKNIKKGAVRRARLYYLRALSGKNARIKEKTFTKKLDVSLKGKSRRYNWTWDEKLVK